MKLLKVTNLPFAGKSDLGSVLSVRTPLFALLEAREVVLASSTTKVRFTLVGAVVKVIRSLRSNIGGANSGRSRCSTFLLSQSRNRDNELDGRRKTR
uniref:Putative salivary kunitz domain protein n=1 Tax=Ixodes ricinus TaxID=34613 RepID=A0A0K8RDH2_IXORI